MEFNGSYELAKSENMAEYFEASDMQAMAKQLVGQDINKHNTTVQKDGDSWTITSNLETKTNVIKFDIGKEFENSMGTRTFKGIASMENENTLVITHTNEKGVSSVRKFAFNDTGFVLTLSASNHAVVATRQFTRA